jgi:hypothetical protein
MSTVVVVSGNDPIVLQQGADLLVVSLVEVDGVPVADLTGWTIRSQIRPYRTAPELYYEFDPDNISTDAPNVELLLPAADSTQFDWYYGYYDIEAVDPIGPVHRIAQGWFQVDPETTI